jgi:hypothetical protein
MSPSRTSAVGEPIGAELRWKASCAVMAIIVGGKQIHLSFSFPKNRVSEERATKRCYSHEIQRQI